MKLTTIIRKKNGKIKEEDYRKINSYFNDRKQRSYYILKSTNAKNLKEFSILGYSKKGKKLYLSIKDNLDISDFFSYLSQNGFARMDSKINLRE